MVVPLLMPTSDTTLLVQAAVASLRQIYAHGFQLTKARVMLLDLMPNTLNQGELDLQDEDAPERAQLMSAMDTLNGRFGKGAVHGASTGADDTGRVWGDATGAPGFTTRCDEVPVARA